MFIYLFHFCSDQPHQQHEMLPTVKEVLLLGLGHNKSRPFLMVRQKDFQEKNNLQNIEELLKTML